MKNTVYRFISENNIKLIFDTFHDRICQFYVRMFTDISLQCLKDKSTYAKKDHSVGQVDDV